MEDSRVWALEESLWTGGAEHYRELVDASCVMVLPQPPYVMSGSEAIEAVARSPRWTEVELSERRMERPQPGMIAIAYRARAKRGGEHYEAWCSSTYRRLDHDAWCVVQHQQTPPLSLKA
ncbi:MAG: hypothetical protein AB7P21_16545 [Lautropia sp.]